MPMYLTFSLPVSANQRLMRARGSKALISSSKYRQWKEKAYLEVSSLLRQNSLRFTNGERISLTLKIHFPDKRRRDIDNYVKGAQDLLTDCGVWSDDTQIDDLHVLRCEISKEPYVEAVIEEIGKKKCNVFLNFSTLITMRCASYWAALRGFSSLCSETEKHRSHGAQE